MYALQCVCVDMHADVCAAIHVDLCAGICADSCCVCHTNESQSQHVCSAMRVDMR